MTDFNALISRLEAASGPDREIDAALHVALCDPEQYPDDLRYYRLPVASDECAPGTYWLKQRSGASLKTAPLYSASLDAIVALITRRCPPGRDDAREPLRERFGWTINMAQRLDWTWEAYLYRVSDGLKGFAICPTPALALCLALVRAKMAREQEKRDE